MHLFQKRTEAVNFFSSLADALIPRLFQAD
jgi:hypothetical protein